MPEPRVRSLVESPVFAHPCLYVRGLPSEVLYADFKGQWGHGVEYVGVDRHWLCNVVLEFMVASAARRSFNVWCVVIFCALAAYAM